MTPLPPEFPYYKLLSEGGFLTVESVREASVGSGQALIDIKGIGGVALENIRRALLDLPSAPPEVVNDLAPSADLETGTQAVAVTTSVASDEVRVLVAVGMLYHAGRLYTRGEHVRMPLATAQRLRLRDHVRF
jgi:hypothetical protein